MEKLGFLGLGIMGTPMSRNLLKAGFDLMVFDVDAAKVSPLVNEGAKAAANPAEMAARVDIMLACLPSADIVNSVVNGKDGILQGCRKGQLFVDMTTSYPEASIAVSKKLESKGVEMLDAPVSGGDIGAEQATLSIMCGGARDAYERCMPVFRAMGRRITLMGEQVGAGGYAKLTNQIMVSIHLASVAEAFVFAKKAGLDLAKLVPALEAGWANSTVLNVKAPKILKNDYSPAGTVRVQHKDLSYILRTMDSLGMKLPLCPQIHAMYQQLIDAGEDGVDQMALIHVFEQLAGVRMNE
jgi:2-hydroxy-3-oxopropionate reductase